MRSEGLCAEMHVIADLAGQHSQGHKQCQYSKGAGLESTSTSRVRSSAMQRMSCLLVGRQIALAV